MEPFKRSSALASASLDGSILAMRSSRRRSLDSDFTANSLKLRIASGHIPSERDAAKTFIVTASSDDIAILSDFDPLPLDTQQHSDGRETVLAIDPSSQYRKLGNDCLPSLSIT